MKLKAPARSVYFLIQKLAAGFLDGSRKGGEMLLFSPFNYFAELLTAGSSDPQVFYLKSFFFFIWTFLSIENFIHVYNAVCTNSSPFMSSFFKSAGSSCTCMDHILEDNRIPLPLKPSSANSSLAGGGGGDFTSPSQSRLGFGLAWPLAGFICAVSHCEFMCVMVLSCLANTASCRHLLLLRPISSCLPAPLPWWCSYVQTQRPKDSDSTLSSSHWAKGCKVQTPLLMTSARAQHSLRSLFSTHVDFFRLSDDCWRLSHGPAECSAFCLCDILERAYFFTNSR